MEWEANDFDEEDEGFGEDWEGEGLGEEDEGLGEEDEALDGFSQRVLRIARRETPDTLERSLWLDLWRAPVLDAVEEQGLETRSYGPLQATVLATLPEAPQANLLLGAAEPEAVRGGHLIEALEWIDSLEIDCRVPIDTERPEAGAAEDVLNRFGYRRTESQVRLRRDASPPGFPAPAGIEAIEVEEFTEGFGDLLAGGYELGWAGWLFDCLPGRHPWRCYLVLDGQGTPLGAAAMMINCEIAHFGFAATAEAARGRGAHLALLHRCILDGAKRCPTLLAETTEPLGERDGPSPGCRNLLRAGFRQDSVRTTWRPLRG